MSEATANPDDAGIGPGNEQAGAETVDEEKVDELDFPPEEPMGVGHWGETGVEEALGEPVAERAEAEVPDFGERPLRTDEEPGMLVDEDQGVGPDEEKDMVGDDVPYAEPPSAEEDAVHLEES